MDMTDDFEFDLNVLQVLSDETLSEKKLFTPESYYNQINLIPQKKYRVFRREISACQSIHYLVCFLISEKKIF